MTSQDLADNKPLLDDVLKIFDNLEPVDVLSLARTTRTFRAFLFDRRESRRVWRTAIGKVPGLPPCLDHLSEPAYTHLAFVPVCHGCFRPCDTIEWEIRMRCCPACLRKMYVPEMPRCRDYAGHGDEARSSRLSDRHPLPVAVKWCTRPVRSAATEHNEMRRDGAFALVVHFPLVLRLSDREELLARLRSSNWRNQKRFVEQEDKVGAHRGGADTDNLSAGDVRPARGCWHVRLCHNWENDRLKRQTDLLFQADFPRAGSTARKRTVGSA